MCPINKFVGNFLNVDTEKIDVLDALAGNKVKDGELSLAV